MNDTFVLIPDNFDPEEDFDQINPQIKYITPFQELHNNKDLNYSRTMWSIVFLTESDPEQNKLYRLQLPERLKAIQNYYPEFNPDLEIIKTCIESYVYTCIPALRRSLTDTKNFLIRRSDYLNSVEYSIDNMKDIDTALSKSGKLWEEFEKVEERYSTSKKDSSIIYGGRRESLAEQKKL